MHVHNSNGACKVCQYRQPLEFDENMRHGQAVAVAEYEHVYTCNNMQQNRQY